ncbi:class I SAM-dependent methyltransferase [Umezawaea tangerina]|uniref:class I SAM-dependent methyltransferase n=1 Tax=Umezawaea tangerina TaxID=84725 RepID=UPI000D06D828|nr:class I SAM-dependent methyltransferase [Umezawaea tangerina]
MTGSVDEDFLRAFHDSRPGEQSASVEASRTTTGRTSYEEFADLVPDARRVLDLGCADGGLLEVLARRGADVLAGVDLSEAELGLARRRPALAGADLRLGRAQELPFADASFDAVFSHMAFMLMTDVEQVVAEVARVLEPGGAFSVAVGGGAVEGEAMELFLSLAVPFFRAAGTMPRLGDRRSRTREGLDGLLGPAGFAPVTWEPVVIDMGGPPEHVWDRMTGSFYDMVVLGADQVADLRASFLDSVRAQASGGRVPCGMRVVHATTRLAT